MFAIFLISACSNNDTVEVNNPDFLEVKNVSDTSSSELTFDIINTSNETFYFNHLEYRFIRNNNNNWVELSELSNTQSLDLVGPTPVIPGETYSFTVPLNRNTSELLEMGPYGLLYEGSRDTDEDSNQETFDFYIEFNLR